MSEINKAKYVDIPAQVAQDGDNDWRQGMYPSARMHYSRAAQLYNEKEDYQGEAQVLNRMAEMELSLEEYEQAEKILDNSLEIVKDLTDAESTHIETLILQSKVYTAQYKLEKALSTIKQAEKEFHTSGGILLGDCYDQEAYIHLVMGNEAKALDAYERAAHIFAEEHTGLKEASALRSMARIEMKFQNYERAHDLLERCRELYRENGDLLGEASSLSAIGCLRYIIRDIEKARKALMKAVYLYGKVSHHFAEAEALLYLARVESYNKEEGDFERAKSHYKKSIELYDFLQNETMKNAVVEEYDNFLKREMMK